MPRCPSCFTPLTRVQEDGIRYFTCPSCFGHWINTVALLRRVSMDAQAAPGTTALEKTSLVDLAETVAASSSPGPLHCTECDKPMTKDRYHPMIPVQIDRCKPCERLWLDAGEFSLIRQLYVELSTSKDPEVIRRRDRLGATLSAWEQKRADDLYGPDDAGAGSDINGGFDLLLHLLRCL